MSYRYINNLITKDKFSQFLELVDMAAGSGKDTNNAFDLSERLHASNAMKVCIQRLQSDPATAEMLEQRYIGPLYDLPALLEMPKYSLGWTFGRVINTLGYDPNFYRKPETINNDAEYITYRVYKTHDLHHILTGFSLDGMGELGVISLSISQFSYPGFMFLDLMALLSNFFVNEQPYSEELENKDKVRTVGYAFGLINKGIEMGLAAKPLFAVKLEEQLERPIDQLRQELGIIPVTEGLYSWYSNPSLKEAVA
ncbi:MAG: Coq4 family protein [Cyanobacteriota bacterium ELA615]